MKPLTAQQRRVLDFISREVAERGYPPSVRDICAALGFRSSSTAHRYLAALEKMGYLERGAARPRAIRIIEGDGGRMQCRYLPVIGRISAGKPLLAHENLEGYFPLPDVYKRQLQYRPCCIEVEARVGPSLSRRLAPYSRPPAEEPPEVENGDV